MTSAFSRTLLSASYRKTARVALARTPGVANRSTNRCHGFKSTAHLRAPRYVRFSPDPESLLDVSKWNLKTKVFVGVALLGTGYYLYHLEQVPGTGRWRFIDIKPEAEARLAETNRRQIEIEYRDRIFPPNHILTRHVRRIVSQLLEANDLGYLRSDTNTLNGGDQAPSEEIWRPDDNASSGGSQVLSGHPREWTVFVVDNDKILNAFASMGTIVVFTGILPLCKDEHGLASVLSHEIAHVVFRHSTEIYSSVKVALAFATFLEQVLGLGDYIAKRLTRFLYELPMSRTYELEADRLGIEIAAKACFDPEAPIAVLSRLTSASKRWHVDFLYTHPSNEKRIKMLTDLLPMAYSLRANSPKCAGLSDQVHAFRVAAENSENIPAEEGLMST